MILHLTICSLNYTESISNLSNKKEMSYKVQLFILKCVFLMVTIFCSILEVTTIESLP